MVNRDGYGLTKAGNPLGSLHLFASNLGSLFVGLLLAIYEQIDRWKGLIKKSNKPLDSMLHFIDLRVGLICFQRFWLAFILLQLVLIV